MAIKEEEQDNRKTFDDLLVIWRNGHTLNNP